MGVYLNSTPAELTLAKDLDKRPLEAIGALYQKKYAERAAEVAGIKKDQEVLGKTLKQLEIHANAARTLGSGVEKFGLGDSKVNQEIKMYNEKINEIRDRVGKKLGSNSQDINQEILEFESLSPGLKALSRKIDNQNAFVDSVEKELSTSLKDKPLDGRALALNKQIEDLNSNHDWSEPVAPVGVASYYDVQKDLEDTVEKMNKVVNEDAEPTLETQLLKDYNKAYMQSRTTTGLTDEQRAKGLELYAKHNPKIMDYLQSTATAELDGYLRNIQRNDPAAYYSLNNKLTENQRAAAPIEIGYAHNPENDGVERKDGNGVISKSSYTNGGKFNKVAYEAAVRSMGKESDARGINILKHEQNIKTMGIVNAVAIVPEQGVTYKRQVVTPTAGSKASGIGMGDFRQLKDAAIVGTQDAFLLEVPGGKTYKLGDHGMLYEGTGGFVIGDVPVKSSDELYAAFLASQQKLPLKERLNEADLQDAQKYIFDNYNDHIRNEDAAIGGSSAGGSWANVMERAWKNIPGTTGQGKRDANNFINDTFRPSSAELDPADVYKNAKGNMKNAYDANLEALNVQYGKPKGSTELLGLAIQNTTSKNNFSPSVVTSNNSKFKNLFGTIKASTRGMKNYYMPYKDAQNPGGITQAEENEYIDDITGIRLPRKDGVLTVSANVKVGNTIVPGKENVLVDLDVATLSTPELRVAYNNLGMFRTNNTGKIHKIQEVHNGKIIEIPVQLINGNMMVIGKNGNLIRNLGTQKYYQDMFLKLLSSGQESAASSAVMAEYNQYNSASENQDNSGEE